jgi:hypothetical protein
MERGRTEEKRAVKMIKKMGRIDYKRELEALAVLSYKNEVRQPFCDDLATHLLTRLPVPRFFCELHWLVRDGHARLHCHGLSRTRLTGSILGLDARPLAGVRGEGHHGAGAQGVVFHAWAPFHASRSQTSRMSISNRVERSTLADTISYRTFW